VCDADKGNAAGLSDTNWDDTWGTENVFTTVGDAVKGSAAGLTDTDWDDTLGTENAFT
jgi:hypothetical protein